MNLPELAFRLGRRIGKHPLAGWLFCLAERMLPVKRLARESGLVAFHHPRPLEHPHVLIVPTRPVTSLTTHRLDDESKASLLWNMVELARRLATQLPAADSWQLVINGGTRQDIGQLHGHLLHIADETRDPLRVIAHPETTNHTWSGVMDELRAAEQISDNGYSLVFAWRTDGFVQITVTQST